MRTLITGINGFVGGHLAEHLLVAGGWDVWGMALETELSYPPLREQVQLVSADMRDPAQVAQAVAQVRPQVIFHLAGQAFVPESFHNPAATLTNNMLAQLNLFLALLEHHIDARVLVVSSYEVYGAIQPDDLPIDEETPLRPTNPYGVSKIAQDMLALQYHQSHHLDVVRVRPFNHIGPRQNDRFVAASFAHQVARIEAGLQPPVMSVGNLSARRDFTDVRDMVQAYVYAVQSGVAGQVYNVGSGCAVLVQELLDMLLSSSQLPIAVQQDPERMRPVDIPVVICNASRFRQQTGWQPRIALAQTLHDMLDDWRNRITMEKQYL